MTAQDLLAHAKEECHDPDCELHNPEVGISEEVVNLTELAFFVAGAYVMYSLIDKEYTASGKYNSTTLANAINEFHNNHTRGVTSHS